MPSGLVYDEQSLVDEQIHKYDKFLHSRINKYTGSGRTPAIYYNIDDTNTTTSLGLDSNYGVIGHDSPLRYRKIINMILIGFSPLNPQNNTAASTSIRNYDLSGDAFIIPGTIMPKENDFFIVKHVQMTHLMRVTEVTQDGLNTDGSYRISYSLYSTSPTDIDQLNRQVIGEQIMDLQTVGGEDLTPVIGKEDYELRSRLIKMVDDMVENYIANFYDHKHNCFILRLDGCALFDPCGNMFMSRNGVMIRDNAHGNIVLNENKIRDTRMEYLYQRSPYKWIERDAPLRYLDTFKYRLLKAYNYPDSSFANYGDDIDVMIPGESWCEHPDCQFYFPMEVYNILDAECDCRKCNECKCKCCEHRRHCIRAYHLKNYDYISLLRGFIHGEIRSIQDLSLYIGDQLFDNSMSRDVFLWTPIIIYIIKQTLKIK